MEDEAPLDRDRDWDGALEVVGVHEAFDKMHLPMPGLLTTSTTTIKTSTPDSTTISSSMSVWPEYDGMFTIEPDYMTPGDIIIIPGLLTTSTTTVKASKPGSDTILSSSMSVLPGDHGLLTIDPDYMTPGDIVIKNTPIPGLLTASTPTIKPFKPTFSDGPLPSNLLSSVLQSVLTEDLLTPASVQYDTNEPGKTPYPQRVVMQRLMPPHARKVPGAPRRNMLLPHLAKMPPAYTHPARRHNRKLWG